MWSETKLYLDILFNSIKSIFCFHKMGLKADIRKCNYDLVYWAGISVQQVGVETDLKEGWLLFYGGREKGNLRILLGFYDFVSLLSHLVITRRIKFKVPMKG